MTFEYLAQINSLFDILQHHLIVPIKDWQGIRVQVILRLIGDTTDSLETLKCLIPVTIHRLTTSLTQQTLSLPEKSRKIIIYLF